jgi:predicted N-acetyltransferase YhbS
MTLSDVVIRAAVPDDRADISRLHAALFGPGRFARTAYRIREAAGGAGFGLVARREFGPDLAGSEPPLIGSVHFTPITIGDKAGALLLGPLAVAFAYKSRGHGTALVSAGMAHGRDIGAAIVLLVGDLGYYGKMGFAPLEPGRITMPGPCDPARLLAAELLPGARQAYAGQVGAAPALPSGSQRLSRYQASAMKPSSKASASAPA